MMHTRTFKTLLAAGCGATALVCGAGQAMAAAAANTTGSVEEVVVTANKRSELLREVPAAVTAVTSSSLQNIGAARLDDYVAKIPGLTVSNVTVANGSNQLAIRGLTTGIGGNPTVGIYIDDSPFGASGGFAAFNAPDLDPQDLARVEVLRGPQGTLYGAGSLGGLLKYVTADPDPSHFFGRLQADASTVDGGGQGYGVRGAANVPVNDKVALRVSAYDRADPGYVDDVLTGEENVNDYRAYGGRVALGAQLNDDWKVRLSALYQHQRGAGPVVDYNPLTFQPTYGDLEQSRGFGTGVGDQGLAAFNLEINGKLGDFATLTSSTSYNRARMHFSIDGTNLYGPLISAITGVPNVGAAIVSDAGLDKFTQEVRLASPSENRLSWQIGGFYTHENSSSVQTLPTFDPMNGTPITGMPLFLDDYLHGVFEEKAVFGDATWHFSPRFDVTGGVRYSHNDQEDISIGDGILVGGPNASDVTSSDSSVTWLLTPRFHLNDTTMLYARYATGYRPGGPNALGGAPGVPLGFGPDKVINYEVGLKSDLLDHRASIELAAYWIDWKDIQVQEITPLGLSFLDNAGTAVSRGVEASGTWRPIDGLNLAANVTYIDAHLTQDLPAGGATALEGDRLPLTPHWSGALSADYSFPLTGQWNGLVGAEWHHVGETLGAFPNPGLPRFEHPAYDTVDLRAGVSNEHWTLTLFAKNIGDSRGQTSDLAFGDTRVSVIQPRTFAVSLSTTF
jgi:outer membrane receptor protein involved in Fe transport